MNHLNTLQKLISNNTKKLSSKLLNLKTIAFFGLASLLAATTWFYGPLLEYKGYALLAQKEKRIYLILFIYIAWLLELLIKDIDPPNPNKYTDALTQKKLHACFNRFIGALGFLRKTTINKLGKQIHLSQLPWVLLLGPTNSGKTSLLATANIHFILQRQFKQNENSIESTTHADWWVTKDHTIIDLPGRYLMPLNANTKDKPKAGSAPILWSFFLKLIRKYRGKNGINGILFAMPIAEFIKHPDEKHIENTINYQIKRLLEAANLFPGNIPIHIVLTKCDLFNGFKEYFSEIGNDEATQAWGINFSDVHESNLLLKSFKLKFNALIKKLNEQLLTKLHQERNSKARPLIKEFPLEIERSRDCLENIIKKLLQHCPQLKINGIYLTSSQQNQLSSEKALAHTQLLDMPDHPSRSYFSKQVLNLDLSNSKTVKDKKNWGYRLTYSFAIALVLLTAVLLGKDFERGIKNVYRIQNQITHYQYSSNRFHNRDEKLNNTLKLLNELQQARLATQFKLDLNHLLSFYTFKSKETANLLYYKSIQNILIPQIKHYLEDYLAIPINKSNDALYSALRSYLMLGDQQHFNAEYITSTIHKVMPKSFSKKQVKMLNQHLALAFASHNHSYPLNQATIQKTRDYLTSNSQLDLAELILENFSENNQPQPLYIFKSESTAFQAKQASINVPKMYTAKLFPNILSHQIQLAAKQAVVGNWVLGPQAQNNQTNSNISEVTKALHHKYIQNYAQTWENLLQHLHLKHPVTLTQADLMINSLISNHSPLLKLLQTVRDNTFLAPVAEQSPKLKAISLLLDKNNVSEKQLYDIFTSLKSLQNYIEPVIHAKDTQKEAFKIVKERMQHASVDPITQLRLIADQSPEPVKKWLNQLANDSWKFLSKAAGQYINTAWQHEVTPAFKKQIIKHYPFDPKAKKEVAIKDFQHFFGKPGIIVSFYQNYLKSFVDESQPSWKWRSLGKNSLPFSEESLRHIQQAMKIHQAFFPNDDNQLFVQFSLEPYEFGKDIQKVSLNICNKKITDNKANKNAHLFTWPNIKDTNLTEIAFTQEKDKITQHAIKGTWSWFKLVNESFDTVISKKQIALNLSKNEQPVKYYLHTKGKTNPFISLNMKHFKLSETLT